MRQMRAFFIRLRNIFARERRDRDFAEELESNLQFHIADNLRAGMTPADARRNALIELGGIDQTKELYRDRRGVPVLENLLQDIRYGVRFLWKNPAFTVVAIVTLALGIGANTGIFSMVDWILLRPLPVPHSGEIVEIAYQVKGGDVRNQFSFPDYRDIRGQSNDVFSAVFGSMIGIDGLSVNNRPERLLTNYVTGNYFTGLAVEPALGRLFLPSEGESAGADPVVVLGYSYWQNRFHADRNIVGQKVLVNGHPLTVIGVAPKGFHGTFGFVDPQAYLPFGMQVLERTPADFMANRGAMKNLVIMARLRPGVSLPQAQAVLRLIAGRLASQYPEDKDVSLFVYPELRARPQPSVQNIVQVLAVLFLGLATMLLLLACLNVANILMVRATVRKREMAIRAALGAGRGRLVRQLLTESVLLAVAGAVAGVALGHWGTAALSRMNMNTDLPLMLDFAFDWRVFAYALAIALVTGIMVGIVPAFRVSRGNLNVVLHQSGRSVLGAGQRLRSSLVVLQVAGSLMLLIFAGLFMRSLQHVQQIRLGFDPSHVLTAGMDPSEVGYDAQEGRAFYRNMLTRMRALPGVASATTSMSIPMGYMSASDNLAIDDYNPGPGETPPSSLYNAVSSDYFQTLRIPLLNGRGLNQRDDERAPFVAVVNQAFARKYWPNVNPIGRRFRLMSEPKHSIEVVGVAQDSRLDSLVGRILPGIYVPLQQHYDCCSLQFLQVRTAGDPSALAPDVERIVHDLAPDMPVFEVKPMKQAIETLNGLLMFEIGAALAAVMGALGLLLSIVGVYGVISYSAAQRTQEIGVRMALGARGPQIVAMVLRQGLWIIGIGVAIGLACTFTLARLVSDALIVSPTDPVTYVTVSAFLAFVGVTACYVPARRTLRVDPMVALRSE